MEEICRFVLLGNGRLGFALKLMAAMQELLKRMELITHPSAILASRLIAGHQPRAAIGGHANAVEEVMAEVFQVRVPGLSRAVRSQFDFEDRGTLRLQGDQDGDTDGKEFLTEIKRELSRAPQSSEQFVWLNRRYGETETQLSPSAIMPSTRADSSQNAVI